MEPKRSNAWGDDHRALRKPVVPAFASSLWRHPHETAIIDGGRLIRLFPPF
jgi:hypothetical protein